ncbi:MAG TPA: tail fiber domain-containing protein [Gaiellales bacterium]|nr:tail fiber domain-containing protein [Gaiellales bacterium]
MATLERPVKEGNARTYQAKVALGYVDILASEVDADLDVIYAAWNGGVSTANLVDGSVTYAKLAPDAQLWRDTGSTITPGTNFATRLIQWGATGTVKYCLADAAGSLQIQANMLTGSTPTDTAKSQWILAISPAADALSIFRSPPGATAAFVEKLKVDGFGNLLVDAGALLLNSGGRVTTIPNLHQESLNEVGVPGQDTTKAAWKWGANATNDNFFVQRAPANTTAFANDLALDASGNLSVLASISTGGATSAPSMPGVRVAGTTAGIRAAFGNLYPDGYGSAIALGWTGALKARVDGTDIGTITVTASDARVKQDVREDVPGLAAVAALRPVSFEYDQEARPIGFESGRHYGLIAQEVLPHAPLSVTGDETTLFGIEYGRLVPILIRAIQELAQKVEVLAA